MKAKKEMDVDGDSRPKGVRIKAAGTSSSKTKVKLSKAKKACDDSKAEAGTAAAGTAGMLLG